MLVAVVLVNCVVDSLIRRRIRTAETCNSRNFCKLLPWKQWSRCSKFVLRKSASLHGFHLHSVIYTTYYSLRNSFLMFKLLIYDLTYYNKYIVSYIKPRPIPTLNCIEDT